LREIIDVKIQLCSHSHGDNIRRELAFTRYDFTLKLLWGSQTSVYCPPTCEAYTIAILLHDYCAIHDPSTDPPFVCHTPYTISNGNIV